MERWGRGGAEGEVLMRGGGLRRKGGGSGRGNGGREPRGKEEGGWSE